jgi:hypothetical protein
MGKMNYLYCNKNFTRKKKEKKGGKKREEKK